MPENYLGEITPFGGNFAIRGWALCDGQLLPISSYSALYSILGTTYGGDGRSTFGLPDLRGRVAIHQGQGSSLSDYRLGAKGGTETVTLTTNQMPAHSHAYFASPNDNTQAIPTGNALPSADVENPYATSTPIISMNSGVIGNTGGGQSHNNLQPYLALTRIIATVGVYPSRN